jgi:hypothetical protein
MFVMAEATRRIGLQSAKIDFFYALQAQIRSCRSFPPVGPTRGRGRPPGKRSDPDYQPTTVLLRKQTKKAATRLLEDQDTGQDLSELIEELLTGWIQQRS